jgi:hypothetical protein
LERLGDVLKVELETVLEEELELGLGKMQAEVEMAQELAELK